MYSKYDDPNYVPSERERDRLRFLLVRRDALRKDLDAVENEIDAIDHRLYLIDNPPK